MDLHFSNIFNRIFPVKFSLLLCPIIVFLLFPLSVSSQQKSFHQEDVWSVFVRKSKRAAHDSAESKPAIMYKPYFSITPYVGYNPAYGGLIGIGSTVGMYLGEPGETPISSAVVGASYTTMNQLLLTLRTNLIADSSRYILRGDWRYLLFSQSTYGLGSGQGFQNSGGIILNDGGQTYDILPDEQPINYNYLRLYETFYFKITKKIYAGIGFDLDHYWSIEDTKLNLDTIPPDSTYHWTYCKEHGFDTAHYTISGLSLELLLDTRDNTIRPTHGMLANIAFRPNFTWLGSSKGSWMLNTEFRYYKNLSKLRPDHLIGFWYIGQFTQKGKVPYLGLPAIGWDMYNRTGRGYIQGSIRGVNFLYGEVEYRFPISKYTGILGGVLFLNATTASNDTGTQKLFQYFDPAVGGGIRIMFNKTTLSNLTVDLAIGSMGKLAVYFNLNETF
jgi:hypothetical protein